VPGLSDNSFVKQRALAKERWRGFERRNGTGEFCTGVFPPFDRVKEGKTKNFGKTKGTAVTAGEEKKGNGRRIAQLNVQGTMTGTTKTEKASKRLSFSAETLGPVKCKQGASGAHTEIMIRKPPGPQGQTNVGPKKKKLTAGIAGKTLVGGDFP